MEKEFPKSYLSSDYEDNIYQQWEKSGFFDPDNLTGEPYSIMMPPPNVTGVLHLGHALENSLMDIMARYQRMNGKKVLLLPGTDHAAVATQAKVEKILVDQGLNNPRQELGREKLLAKVKEFSEVSKATILSQIRKLGTSCDWSRLAYTFDEQRSRAVNEIFVKMYHDGLIYRGKRIINWDAKLQTTISDDEIVWQEEKTPFYYLQYGPFVIATARPETKFGDKYVVMHPDDRRYKKYKHGDKFDCEWINGKVAATVIKDKVIDPKFGTGVMTITPWHDMVDFDIAERHQLDAEQIIDFNGRLRPIAGEFAGMDIMAARPKIVDKLEQKGLLVKIEENYLHRVAKGDRSHGLVEPQIKEQWFVAVNKIIPGRGKSLKDLMREAVTVGHRGDKKQKIMITPIRFEKTYLSWIDNLRDWCISRQIWWGHRIPVYYHKQGISNFQFPISNKIPNPKPRMSKVWELKIYGEDIFKAIKNGNKTIETRAGREKGTGKDWSEFKPGDTIRFYLAKEKTDKILPSVEPVEKSIKAIKHFKSIEQLFKAYGPGQDYPGKTVKQIKQWWSQRVELEQRIKKFGIWAFELGDLNEQEIYVGVEPPKGEEWQQDEDTLDTWFSSGLWTFSTLGWPSKNRDLKIFHPTSWMQMGYEILFFWLARMILMSTYALDQIPFKEVYIHGILRDELGKKFSKSAGNSVDPLEVIKEYGTDALRFSLLSGVTPGNDQRFYEEKVEGARNLVNKLWNVSRYILSNFQFSMFNFQLNSKNLTLTDKWILGKMDKLIIEVTEDLGNYRFSQAAEKLREFSWNDLADWYVEVSKFETGGEKEKILPFILKNLLKLWHPFMPFITEVLWKELKSNKLLMIEKWPSPLNHPQSKREKESGGGLSSDFEMIKEIVVTIRNARSIYRLEPGKKIRAVIYAGVKEKTVKEQAELIKKLRTGVDLLEIKKSGEKIKQAIYLTINGVEIYLVVPDFDFAKEKARLSKAITTQQERIKNLEQKLANKEFIKKAPPEVVDKEKDKLTGGKQELKKLNQQLKSLPR